jgi:toxin ParE1/3/4
MKTAGYRLTEAAAADVRSILEASARQFGPIQRELYAKLIEKAAEMVAETPARPGSRKRYDIAEGVRSFHVEHAASRRGAAVHMLYYVTEFLEDALDSVVILRVLHERMEPAIHMSEHPNAH